MFGTGLTTDTTGPGAPRVVKDSLLRAVPSGFFSYTSSSRGRLPVNISIAKIAKKAALHPNPNSPFSPSLNTQRGEIADRTVPRPDRTSGQIGITQRIVSARRMGDPGKGQLFSVWPISASTFRTESDRSSYAGPMRPSLNICIYKPNPICHVAGTTRYLNTNPELALPSSFRLAF